LKQALRGSGEIPLDFRFWQHLADIGDLANVRFAPILLQKSKIEQREKSRESRSRGFLLLHRLSATLRRSVVDFG
jgi:hypothetical protein